MTRLAAIPLILVSVALIGCGTDDPGTSVEVALTYDDALKLDKADVTLLDRTQSASIAHQLLLLVPDERAGMEMPIAVWARKAGKRAAYGTTSAVPVLGETVTTSLTLTACSPGCQGAMLTTCTGPMVSCVLGCSDEGDAHCIAPRPSNGVDPAAADPLSGTTKISASTTFDVDTGAITGGLTRAAVTGIDRGIGYFQAPAFAFGGAPLGIFVFHNLTIDASVTVQVTGTRAVVWLVGDVANIAGLVDVAAGRGARSVPGPGGGAGGTATAVAQGCGAGGPGGRGPGSNDGGGGGGGAGTAGAAGGTGQNTTTDIAPGGVAGSACLPSNLEPLRGGSGGGIGGVGSAPTPANGGGGGGALQITALGSLEITGTINAGGAGGEGGTGVAANSEFGSNAGGGGGTGGAILLEAPVVTVGSTAIVAANGGGGGGAGDNVLAGNPGDSARASLTRAAGGLGAPPDVRTTGGGSGGAGGVAGMAPVIGGGGSVTIAMANGGGGGGAVGAITLRGRTVTVTGLTTPNAVRLDVQIRNAQ